MKTLRSQLIHFFKTEQGETNSGELERMVFTNKKTNGTYKPSNVTREARRLAEEGIIQVHYQRGVAVYSYEKSEFEKMHESVKMGGVDLEARTIKLL